MFDTQCVGNILETKYGKVKSANVREQINNAYTSGMSGENLGIYLKNCLKEEGITDENNSIRPPILYPHSV